MNEQEQVVKQEELKESQQETEKLAEIKTMTEKLVQELTKPLQEQAEKISNLTENLKAKTEQEVQSKQQQQTATQDAQKFEDWKLWHQNDPAAATAALVASVGKQVMEKAQETAKNVVSEQYKIQQEYNNSVKSFLKEHPDVSWNELAVKIQDIIEEKGQSANSPLLMDLARERILREKGGSEPPHSEKGKSGKGVIPVSTETKETDIFAGALKLRSPMDI